MSAEAAKKSDSRISKRANITWRVHLYKVDHTDAWGRTENLSCRGALIQCECPLCVDETVKLEIHATGDKKPRTIIAIAIVKHAVVAGTGSKYGLYLKSLKESDQKFLKQFVEEHASQVSLI